MTRTRKALRTFVVLGALAALASVGAFSAFSSQTDNPNNLVTAGSVALSDNDGGNAAYNLPNAKPGDTKSACIRVLYTGSLDADVKLFTPSTIGALGPHVNLTIEPGTQSTPNPDCSGFTADSGGSLFSGTLSSFQSNHNSWANGLADNPGATAKWATNNAVVYKITATLSSAAPDSAQGQSTGTHLFRWEARNQ